jgi:hypothetical protein
MTSILANQPFSLIFDGKFTSENSSVFLSFSDGSDFVIDRVNESNMFSFAFPGLNAETIDYTVNGGDFEGQSELIYVN